MTRLLAASVLAIALSSAGAYALDKEAVNKAEFPAKSGNEPSPAIIKAQVLLDRAQFSPGVIDGFRGDNIAKALKGFERANGLKTDGQLDAETWAKLTAVSGDPVLIEYTITKEDVSGPFVDKIPDEMEEMAKLKRASYTSARELLAEKFHMDEDLLKALNAGKAFDKAGETIVVANVKDHNAKGEVTRIEVDKTDEVLRALGKDGKLIAFYPATIGSDEKPAPSGTLEVRAVAKMPVYTYNPEYKFKGVKAEKPFDIPPGPNNPVGSIWIDLTKEGYGIHGTPEPSKISKSFSHGCIRLTNWDAEELASLVKKGTTVEFLGAGEKSAVTGSTGADQGSASGRSRKKE